MDMVVKISCKNRLNLLPSEVIVTTYTADILWLSDFHLFELPRGIVMTNTLMQLHNHPWQEYWVGIELLKKHAL